MTESKEPFKTVRNSSKNSETKQKKRNETFNYIKIILYLFVGFLIRNFFINLIAL